MNVFRMILVWLSVLTMLAGVVVLTISVAAWLLTVPQFAGIVAALVGRNATPAAYAITSGGAVIVLAGMVAGWIVGRVGR